MEENNKIRRMQIKSKLLLLKKINVKKNSKISKDLKEFFWNKDKYFEPEFKDYYIVVNKNQNDKKNQKSIRRKAGKRFTRKLNSPFIKKNLNDSKRPISNISRVDGNKGMTNNIKETGLKVGQKYINDFELEDLFNAFKTVHEINKTKISDFIAAKEYINNDNNSFNFKL